MKKSIHTAVLLGIVLVLTACNLNVTPTAETVLNQTPLLTLAIQVQNPTDTFDSVGDVINYNYLVSNTGAGPLAGPVTIIDNIATTNCPALNTIGNNNDALDPSESVTCTGTHSLTQADLDAHSVTDVATASIAGGSVVSAPSSITVTLAQVTPGKSLGLTKTANPSTYNQVGQIITYTYVITNTGTLAIGPTQFRVTDDHVGGSASPIPCGTEGSTLDPGATLSCIATYTISQQDLTETSVTNSAVASGADAQSSAPASATIINSNFQGNVTPSITPGSSNLTPGTTISHRVEKGEWLFQIARCYGVEYKKLRNANPQIPNPSEIDPGQIVTVPNIGSAGTIFGPPCVVFHTVVSGDTWNSIAAQYNARVDVLREANPKGLVTGTQIKVPINSAAAGVVPITGGGPILNTPVTPTFTPTAFPTVTPTVTATPTFGSTTPGTGQTSRITLPAGSTSASVSGTLTGYETVSYLVAASQGQTMAINLAASATDIATRVQAPNGLLVKQLDGNLAWTGQLTDAGDYRIDLVGLTDANKNYILTVTLTGP